MATCSTIVFTAINALYMLCVLLEPFMPSFSAKVYEQLAITRVIEHETIIGQFKADPTILTRLVPTGHKIGKVGPIFKEIPISDAAKWKS
jgi:methionyl-tRNA synthetase